MHRNFPPEAGLLWHDPPQADPPAEDKVCSRAREGVDSSDGHGVTHASLKRFAGQAAAAT